MESFSVSTVVAILSSPAPPYSSGTPPPISPSSPPLRTSSAIRPGFLFSRSFARGKTSFNTNSSAVWPISFWSSLKSAGVKTSCGAGDSSRKLPPFAGVLVTTLVAIGDLRTRTEKDQLHSCATIGFYSLHQITAIERAVELPRVAHLAHATRWIRLVCETLRTKLSRQRYIARAERNACVS